MRNNKGVSLVELIVVISIIAILAGVIMISVNSSGSAKLSRAVESLESELAATKTNTLSQDAENIVPLCIKNENGSLYFSDSTGNVLKTFGDRQFELAYILDDGDNDDSNDVKNYLGEGDILKIKFNRGSGSFGIFQLSDSNIAHCKKIIIERNGKSRTMVLVKATGKFYWE